MIENPSKYFDDFINAGADTLIFHHEASDNVSDDLNYIKIKMLSGLALKPETSYKVLKSI